VTRTLVAIRPEPGLSATIEAARRLDLEVIGIELSRVEPVAWKLPDLAAVDALLVGSANAFRHGGPLLAQLQHLPVYAVGKATAAAARDAGFLVEKSGEGGLQSLLDGLAKPMRFLRIAGEERIALTLPRAASMIERIAYRIVAIPVSPFSTKPLLHQAIVLLHSAGAAEHFAREVDRLGVDRATISLAALGPRIAAAAGEGWQELAIAERPNDAHLLALVKDMCK